MLQEIEGDMPAFIKGDNLAINQRIGREPFTGAGDVRELICERFSRLDQSVTPVESLPARQR